MVSTTLHRRSGGSRRRRPVRRTRNPRKRSLKARVYGKKRVKQSRTRRVGGMDQTDVELGVAPEDYLCPISMEVMVDPVVASDGHSYERNCIERWFEGHDRSPKTNRVLSNMHLIPNHALRAAIEQWKEQALQSGRISRQEQNTREINTPVTRSDRSNWRNFNSLSEVNVEDICAIWRSCGQWKYGRIDEIVSSNDGSDKAATMVYIAVETNEDGQIVHKDMSIQAVLAGNDIKKLS